MPTNRDFDLIEVALDSAVHSVQAGATLRMKGVDPLAREYLVALDAVRKWRKEPGTLQVANLSPEEKVRLIEEMGFTRTGSSHQPDCPYAIDAGFKCNCVPPAPEWSAPNDVLEHLGETYEERRTRPRKPIPAVERY